MLDAMISCTTLTTYRLGERLVYVVLNPESCNDFSAWITTDVLLDGQRVHVDAVEYFRHMPPWPAGEPIGLLVTVR